MFDCLVDWIGVLVIVPGCVAIVFAVFAAWKRILRGTLSAAAQSPGRVTCRSTPNRAALRLPAAASLHGEKRGGERALGLLAQGALSK